jgi:prepilin-type N-terminal cleavage/methylation domain-containing protein
MSKRAPSTRGFTLVEVLVALTGALVLSVSVFMATKHTSALYQRESRVASAQMAGVIGFERLRADIGRAGFMASPHARRDPFICGSPVSDPSWPAQMRDMTSVTIEDDTSVPSVLTDNQLDPQRITLAGNYSTAEAFPIRAVLTEAGSYSVYLQVQAGGLSRLGYNSPSADKQTLLETAFPVGRAVRIVDKAGRHHYGKIRTVATAPLPILTLELDSPTLKFRGESDIGCGLRGEETGAMINTVNFIRYRLGSLAADARYEALYPDPPATAYDEDRTELIREELDTDGTVFADSAELIAEFAVDLRFRVTIAATQTATLAYVEQADLSTWVGPADQISAGQGPQLARSVHAWLSVRSREADREETIEVDEGPLFRIGLGQGGGAPFARVRTVQARIALPNQLGVAWQ